MTTEKVEMGRARPARAVAARIEARSSVAFIHATASWVGFYGLLLLCDQLFG